MSATDRIRDDLARVRQPGFECSHVALPLAEAEALCVLAEFARILHPHPACPPDCPVCAALARLDGEEQP